MIVGLLVFIVVLVWLQAKSSKQAKAIKVLEAAVKLQGEWLVYLGDRLDGKNVRAPDEQ